MAETTAQFKARTGMNDAQIAQLPFTTRAVLTQADQQAARAAAPPPNMDFMGKVMQYALGGGEGSPPNVAPQPRPNQMMNGPRPTSIMSPDAIKAAMSGYGQSQVMPQSDINVAMGKSSPRVPYSGPSVRDGVGAMLESVFNRTASPAVAEQRGIIDAERAPIPTPGPVNVTGGQGGAINAIASALSGLGPGIQQTMRGIEANVRGNPIVAAGNEFLFGTRDAPVPYKPPQPIASTGAPPAPVSPPPPPPPVTGGSMLGGHGGYNASGNPAPDEPWAKHETFTPEQINMNSGVTDAAAALRAKYDQLANAIQPDVRTGWAGLLQRLAPALTKFAQTGNVGDLAGGMAEFDEKQRQQVIEALQAGMGGDELALKIAQAQQSLDVANVGQRNEATRYNQDNTYSDGRDRATYNQGERHFKVSTDLQRQQIASTDAARKTQADYLAEDRLLQRKITQAQILSALNPGIPAIQAQAGLTGLPAEQQNDIVMNNVRSNILQGAADNSTRQSMNAILRSEGIKIKNARDIEGINRALTYFMQHPEHYSLLSLGSGNIPSRRER